MTESPWRFLTPLSGGNADDRRLVELTRSDELHLLEQLIASTRISLLYAFSGNGKTSLIDAGVVPFFQRQGYAVFRTRPRPPWSQGDPELAFKQCILRDLPAALLTARDERLLSDLIAVAEKQGGADREALGQVLNRLKALLRLAPAEAVELAQAQLPGYADQRLVEFLGAIADLLGRERRLLLVCDQFEELFVHYGNSRKLERFVDELGEVWAKDSIALHLLFSLREDWVGSMIAFRRAIPEVFKNYFRLSPITVGRADDVLTFPFKADGSGFPLKARQRLLGDLAACYAGSERQTLSGRNSERVFDPEAFIELPALQVVAERLWETREAQAAPFSVVHYESLAALAQAAETDSAGAADAKAATSPAQFVLDHFLMDSLRSATPKESAEEATLTELRLDCLYLLTDGERHRRASRIEQLKRGIRQIRPSELDLPEPDDDAIRRALEPLSVQRLVRRVEGAAGSSDEYELAHDFAVRAVVREWRLLDRRRTLDLGRLTRERRKKEERLTSLEGGQRTLLMLLQILPALGIASFVWAAVFGGQGQLQSLIWWDYLPGPLAVSVGVFFVVGVLGIVAKSRFALVLGVLGILAGVGISAMSSRFQALAGASFSQRLSSGAYSTRLIVRQLQNSSSSQDTQRPGTSPGSRSLLNTIHRGSVPAEKHLGTGQASCVVYLARS